MRRMSKIPKIFVEISSDMDSLVRHLLNDLASECPVLSTKRKNMPDSTLIISKKNN